MGIECGASWWDLARSNILLLSVDGSQPASEVVLGQVLEVVTPGAFAAIVQVAA